MIKLNVHPYPNRVWFTSNKQEFRDKIKELSGEDRSLSQFSGVCWNSYSMKDMLVGVFDKNESTLVHELSHVCINLFEYIGIDVSTKTDEAFCYLIGSLYQQASKHMTKQLNEGKSPNERGGTARATNNYEHGEVIQKSMSFKRGII